MGNNKKRTIVHIYGLDPEKSSRLVTDVCTKTLRTASCVYMWMRGQRTPCYLEAKCIQESVREIYGLDVPINELFEKWRA